MYLRRILGMVLLLSLSAWANVAEVDYLFQKANEAYRAEQYQRADSLYRAILSKGYENGTLYYNLGNCAYKLGNIGEAVLFYRKALKLNPHDDDAAKNLKIARLKVLDKIELPPRFFLLKWWDALIHNWHFTAYGKLALAFWWILFLAAGVWVVVKREALRQWMRRLAMFAGILFLLTAGLGYAAYTAQVEKQQGVVIADVLTARSAPEEHATELFVIHAGTELSVLEKRQGWLKIRLLDGKEGWVPANAVGII